MLDEAARVTLFRPGPARDLTDVRFEGIIARAAAGCEYDPSGLVVVDATIDMVFSRGPAADGDIGRFTYFVAITDPNQSVVARREFSLDVEFPGEAKRVQAREQVTQRFDFAPAGDASRHRIFVGFQLTREQLDYERKLRR